MNDFTFIKDYRDNITYRLSFNDLTRRTYGFDFEDWYRQGWWGDVYNPYSFAHDGKIIANVSVNKIHLVVDGAELHAIQLGTVMTDAPFRNRGLSRELMHIILAEYESNADFIYLFANSSVLDFYPRFGFEIVTEYECSTISGDKTQNLQCRKLDPDNAQDQAILFRLIDSMIPASRIGCRYNRGLVMFYCGTVFKDHIHYLPELDIAVVANEIDGVLNVLEIFSDKDFDLDSVVNTLADHQVTKTVFGFTPKSSRTNDVFTVKSDGNDTLFIRSKHPLNLPKAMFPVLSHT